MTSDTKTVLEYETLMLAGLAFLAGMTHLLLKYCISSRCRNIECCYGLVKCDRSVLNEEGVIEMMNDNDTPQIQNRELDV